ncbi:MAG: Mut7-C RNAse domain-containing protein [Labilibaculum antarcticum]
MPETNSIKKKLVFRFYAELNDFLPKWERQKEIVKYFKTPITLSDTMVSFGIPLSEVDLILVNGESVELTYRLKENDRISVYPKFESFDISSHSRLREKPLRETRFILDCHLGKLTKYLRILGFDCFYKNYMDDDAIIDIAAREKRIILTRDKLLLSSSRITHGYYMRSTEKHEQLKELVQKFDLYSQFKSFTRCMICNEHLQSAEKYTIEDKLDSETAQVFNEFYLCPKCDKVYWKGSHFKRMEAFIRNLVSNE